MTPYFVDINPIAFSIPAFVLRWWWAAIAFVVFCGFAWRASRRQTDGSPEQQSERRSTVAFLLAVALVSIGAAGYMAFKKIDVPIGPIGVHWYGLMYLLGFAGAWWLGQRRRAVGRLPVTADQFSDLAFYVMLGVILGGRIGYMVFYDTAELIRNPLSLIRVWEGGMSFHGGLLGVLTAALLWTRRHRLNFFDVMDFVAPLVPIGLGLGRLGNFIGGELWGRRTDVPWGMIFPRALESLNKTRDELHQMYLAGQLNGEARHPSQLYELALEGIVLFGVLWFFSRKPRPRYAVSGLFALLYGLFRFSVEFVREPDVQLGFLAFNWLTMGQILSLPLIAVGLFLLWLSRRSPTLQPRIVNSEEAA